MRRCNIVTRPQKMLSNCTKGNQADSTRMFARGHEQVKYVFPNAKFPFKLDTKAKNVTKFPF